MWLDDTLRLLSVPVDREQRLRTQNVRDPLKEKQLHKALLKLNS